jgi:hypothetical protein
LLLPVNISLIYYVFANSKQCGNPVVQQYYEKRIYQISQKSHDDHWATFRESEVLKKLSGMEEYKKTASKANPYLLHPTSYSDF